MGRRMQRLVQVIRERDACLKRRSLQRARGDGWRGEKAKYPLSRTRSQ